jgi:hypothetical protein
MFRMLLISLGTPYGKENKLLDVFLNIGKYRNGTENGTDRKVDQK